MVKRLSTMRRTWVWSLVGKIPWRRKWQPTPVLLPRKSYGWRSLVQEEPGTGYCPWGHKESDMTEGFHFHFIASWPAYRFLRSQVRWSGIPISKNFPQFVVIHTVKDFNVINEAIDVFLEFSWFFYDPTVIGNLISGSSAFSESSCICASSQFTYCRSLGWKILSITLLACEMSATVW